MLKNKAHSLFIICSVIVCVGVVLAVNYMVDPMQIYRKHRFGSGFYKEARYQVAGFIKSYLPDGYDSIVIGTSYSENFDVAFIDRTLGWKTLKLCIPGGQIYEREIITRKALVGLAVDNVLWELHPSSFNSRIYGWNKRTPFPKFLYCDSIFSHGEYLLNINTLELSFKLLRGEDLGEDLETYRMWALRPASRKRFDKFNSFENLERLFDEGSKAQASLSEQSPLGRQEYPSLEILKEIVLENQETEFHVFLPPYSLSHTLKKASQNYWRRLQFMRKCLALFGGLDNVNLYAFDNMDGVVNNLANYMDTSHYIQVVNDYIITSIAQGRHRITADTLPEYEASLARLLLKGDLYSDQARAMGPFED